MANIVISYDGTDNDRDALPLGGLLAEAGASLSLAYVRHAPEGDPRAEEAARREAEALLESGAQWLGRPDLPRHVVLSGSTGEGLKRLAHEIGADMVVFGSDYRTPPGRVQPGTSASRMLEGGSVAIGIAPAGLRHQPNLRIAAVGVVREGDDASALETAQDLADHVGARVASNGGGDVDLLVIGSREGGAPGRITMTSAARYLIETVRCPVIVLPLGKAVRLATSATQAQ